VRRAQTPGRRHAAAVLHNYTEGVVWL